MPRRLAPLAVMLLVMLLGACSTEPRPAATVSGSEITDQEVATLAGVFTSIGAVQQVPCGGTELVPGDTEEAACNRFALSALIVSRAAQDYATAHGIEPDPAAVREAASTFEANFGADLLAEALAANGVTRDDFLELVRVDLLQNEVIAAIATEQLDDDAIEQAYEDRLAEFSIVDVDHILVETREEADEIYELVTAPGSKRADFLELAGERSIDPAAADSGGALGPRVAAEYAPEFAQAALALEIGETSEPVQTQFGWHVLRLNDMTRTPLEEVRDQLIGEQATPLFVEHLRGLEESGEIEVNPRYGRYDATSLQVVRTSSTDPSAVIPSGGTSVAPGDG